MKRLIDVLGASLGLVLLSPFLLVIAVLVRISLGRPVLFRQSRPGYRALPFTICKFRTMTTAVDDRGFPFPDHDRLHPIGTFLRKTSLDELPELWNVLRGDMSLVGPRPLLPEYLPFYSQQERLRFAVRPGITGWAQVNGRNHTGWDERLRQDIWYVQYQSLRLDMAILWKTLSSVGRRTGIIVEPHAAMQDLHEERAAVTPERAL
jgi:lipopolysaccharide/colanic/teichoic acid biosynthesis glycosyltransferase